MSRPTIAERGWLGIVIDDYLRPALKNAENIASDLESIELCDASGCGLMFDRRDKRAGIFGEGNQTYHFCPACEMTSQAKAQAVDGVTLQGWQPIESAPKKVQPGAYSPPILRLWDGKRERHGQWEDNRHAKRPRPYWKYSDSHAVADDRGRQPTHWMPLPPPPAASEGEERK